MDEIKKQLEKESQIDEHDIAGKFKKLLPENIEKATKELRAELMAFEFAENYRNSETGWGTYFGPMWVKSNGDGTAIEAPSIHLVDNEIMDYWEKRLRETQNPLLKARYAGLIWDFSQHVKKKKPNYKIGQVYVDSLLEIIEKRLHKYEFNMIDKAKRALQLSISLNSDERINRTKKAILEFDAEIIQNDKPGMWGFPFDSLIGQPKVELSETEEKNIIEKLELKLKYSTDEKSLNPWNAEACAVRLANYYKKKNLNENVFRVIKVLGKAYDNFKPNGSAMQVASWLDHMYKIYLNFGLNKEAKDILIEIREFGPKLNEELKTFSHKHEIPKKEFDDFINFFTVGNKELIIAKIIENFTPKKEEIEKQLFAMSKENPISFLIPMSIQDYKGRVVANVGTLDDDLDGNIIFQLSKNLTYTSIFLRAALDKVVSENILTYEDILDFIKLSPVFEPSRMDIISRGIKAFFENDLIVAIHLLIPQIEEAIRSLIELSKGIVLKQSKSGGFQLKTLDDLIRDNFIKEVFDSDVQLYFKVILTDPRGWNIRNNVCHGITNANSFSYQMIDRIVHILLLLGSLRKTQN